MYQKKRTALEMVRFPVQIAEQRTTYHKSKGLRLRKGGKGRLTTKSTGGKNE